MTWEEIAFNAKNGQNCRFIKQLEKLSDGNENLSPRSLSSLIRRIMSIFQMISGSQEKWRKSKKFFESSLFSNKVTIKKPGGTFFLARSSSFTLNFDCKNKN